MREQKTSENSKAIKLTFEEFMKLDLYWNEDDGANGNEPTQAFRIELEEEEA